MTTYIDPAFRDSLLKKPQDRTVQVNQRLVFFLERERDDGLLSIIIIKGFDVN